jgi:hydrophobic/amphiphilic exporter-1 (mainly G- bacteria), HAE1 family
MSPLLIATGPGAGAEERRSIAVLVVGMSLSLLLTLLAVPVIYSILDDFGKLFVRAPAPVTNAPAPIRASAPVTA